MPDALKYRRVLIKLSGEVLLGERSYGIDPPVVTEIAEQIKQVHALGMDVAIVIGGGNIFRGVAASANGMDRATADYLGMMATVMNAVALQDGLEALGVNSRVLSALEIK